MPDAGYDTDFFSWTQDQARRLREAAGVRSTLDIDWENVAAEVESLGRADKHTLRSRLETILEHLFKLKHSPAAEPRFGWIDTVKRERRQIGLLTEDSPGLRRLIPELIQVVLADAQGYAGDALEHFGENDAATRLRNDAVDELIERVLDDGFIPNRPEPS